MTSFFDVLPMIYPFILLSMLIGDLKKIEIGFAIYYQ